MRLTVSFSGNQTDDNFKKKLSEKLKVSEGFRSVVRSGAWQKLKGIAEV